MELYDDAGLLRSLATAPDRRGEGLGWMLADAALGRARARGCRRVYLITENASDFAAVTTPDDRVAVVATEPLTRDEQWTSGVPGEMWVFRAGKLAATLPSK